MYHYNFISGMITEPHDPVVDALASIQLFKRYYNNPAKLDQAKHTLLHNRPSISWLKQHDYCYEGVCMAAYLPDKCSCGAPTLKNT